MRNPRLAQPAPSVTSADVERVVRREFPEDRIAQVRALLGEYGTADGQQEPHRVRLAALKLAAGNVERLRTQIAEARRDYRDVLAPAEYPEYGRQWSRMTSLTPEEQQQIIDADWRQYQEWLARK